jgi:CheY-like chemotaxis protein
MTKLLFADDNNDIRTIVRAVLKRQAPEIEFEIVSDGEQAVQLVKEMRFDVVCLDTIMPPDQFGGSWAARAIKRICLDVPILFLSSYTLPDDVESGRQAGAIAYLSKALFGLPDLTKNVILARDWRALQAAANGKSIWFFSENLPPGNHILAPEIRYEGQI